MPLPILFMKALIIIAMIAGGWFIWWLLFTDPDGRLDDEWQQLVDDDDPW